MFADSKLQDPINRNSLGTPSTYSYITPYSDPIFASLNNTGGTASTALIPISSYYTGQPIWYGWDAGYYFDERFITEFINVIGLDRSYLPIGPSKRPIILELDGPPSGTYQGFNGVFPKGLAFEFVGADRASNSFYAVYNWDDISHLVDTTGRSLVTTAPVHAQNVDGGFMNDAHDVFETTPAAIRNHAFGPTSNRITHFRTHSVQLNQLSYYPLINNNTGGVATGAWEAGRVDNYGYLSNFWGPPYYYAAWDCTIGGHFPFLGIPFKMSVVGWWPEYTEDGPPVVTYNIYAQTHRMNANGVVTATPPDSPEIVGSVTLPKVGSRNTEIGYGDRYGVNVDFTPNDPSSLVWLSFHRDNSLYMKYPQNPKIMYVSRAVPFTQSFCVCSPNGKLWMPGVTIPLTSFAT
jgi:hypothetical protein